VSTDEASNRNSAKAVAATGLLIAALTLVACGGSKKHDTGAATSRTDAKPVAKETAGGKPVDSIVWATTHTIGSLDPGLVYDSGGNNLVTFSECDSLLRFDNALQLSPGLASSWKQTDPKTYVYTLRQGVKFWDGSPLTAADAAFSINRIIDPKLASPLQSLTSAADVAKAEATGPNQLTITLKKANPIARWLAATPVGQVVSKKSAESHGKSFGTAPSKVMCSGPYRPVSYSKGSATVLEAVPGYWDTAHQPKVKRMTMKEISDPAAIVAGLRSGDITGTFDLDARNARLLQRQPELSVATQPGVQINYVSPNLLKGPLQDPKVRRALSIAIDREGIASAVSGDAAEPLKGPVTPGISSYQQQTFDQAYNALKIPTKPDVAVGKQLVQAAGASGKTVRIGILAGGTADAVGAALGQAGTDVGLKVKIVKLPPDSYFAENFSGKLPRTYDGLVNFWAPDFADPAGELVPPFASRFSNVEGFKSPAYRALEAQWAQTANGSGEQADVLVKMENMLVDETVKIPLYVDPLVQVHRKKVGGYTQTKLYYYQPFLLSMSGS
jgi:peptide/nickel transport system substrate-binding protein